MDNNAAKLVGTSSGGPPLHSNDWGSYGAGGCCLPHSYDGLCQNHDQVTPILFRSSTGLRFVDQTEPFYKRWTYLAYTRDDPTRQKIKS